MEAQSPSRVFKLLSICTIMTLFLPNVIAQNNPSHDTITNLVELRAGIESILEETKTPGAGIVMMSGDSVIWSVGLGMANKEKKMEANENTMFRIGSTSKMFVALSILKLQEEGKVSLKDKVRDLVPEIEFENQWTDTNPILVENLLEHTTGWDDFHLVEYAEQDPTPNTLKEGLDFHPHSRKSRWVPGTRMSYCNSGPPVAAYIVEKITGQDFESYVQENFLNPMGTDNMTYRMSDAYKELGAELYSDGEPQPYWHILMRPSGSINASANDMSKIVQFFVNRGMIDSTQVVSRASLDRMEKCMTTVGSSNNIEVGYGLHNYTNEYGGYIFHGHNGGVNGGLNDFAYLPELNIGYNISINSDRGAALNDISALVKNYLLGDNKKETPITESNKSDGTIDGIYTSRNPRSQMTYFAEKLFDFEKIWTKGDTVYRKLFFDDNVSTYLSEDEGRFISVKTGNINLVQTSDPLLGDVIQSNWTVKSKVSSVKAYGQTGLVILWAVLTLVGLILGLIWFIRYLLGKVPKGASAQIRFWPIISSVVIVLSMIFLIIGASDPFILLGNTSLVAILIAISTLSFGLISCYSIFYLLKNRSTEMNKFTFGFSFALAILNLIAALYLFSHNAIPFISWS